MGDVNVKSAGEILDDTFQEGTERILYKVEDFDSDVETKVLKPSEARIEDLVKGRALPEGTIRTFAGKKFKKTSGKRLPYSEGRKKGADEVGKKRKAKTQVPASEIALSDNVKKAIRKMATGTITSAQIAKKMAISENQVNQILGKKGAVAKTQVPKGERAEEWKITSRGKGDSQTFGLETPDGSKMHSMFFDTAEQARVYLKKKGLKEAGRAQPKGTDEAKVMAASAVKRLKDGGKMRGADRVTEQAQKDGIVDKDGKVTAKGDKYLDKVQKPSQIKKKRKQVKDTRNVSQVVSDAINSVTEGKKIYQHKLTRDQRRSYDAMVKDGHAEWKKESNGDRYLDVTNLGHVQYAVSNLGVKLSADPTNKETEQAFISMTKEYRKIKEGKTSAKRKKYL